VDTRIVETVDIIGQDGVTATGGAVHTMNVNGSWNALGINNKTVDVYDTSLDDYGNFNPVEAWVFKFNADVKLVSLDASSMGGTDQWTMSSTAFSDIVYNAGGATSDLAVLGNVVVPAGVELTLTNTSALEAGHTFRFSEMTVAIPEPATLSLFLVSATGLLFIRRRVRI
jgi:hypothetical protein